MPIWPHCALKCKNVPELGLMGEYSLIWNVTGFPAGVIPVTRVKEDEQTFSDSFNDAWTKALNDDCQGSAGMPISVQVVGYVQKDEQVLGIMKMIEKEIGYKMNMDPKIDLTASDSKFDRVHGFTKNFG